MADRILIVQTKRIGDLALTAPVVASIRRQLPGAEITLVAQGAAGALAPLVPAIDRSVVLSGNWLETRPWLELWGRDFDAAIDLSATDRSRLALEISGAPQRIGFEKWQRRRLLGRAPAYNVPIPGAIGQRHISVFFASSLTGLGLKPETAPAALETPPGFDRTRHQLADLKSRAPLALVHPGTTEPGKFWRPELWARTIGHLVRTHGFQVILSQGRQSTEQHHLNAIRRQLDVPLAIDESRSLEELVLFVQQADLVLGVDTGAMQIAALAERPQVVLFTPRHAIQWAPGQPNAQVILPDAGPHVTGITFDQVCQAIARLRAR